MPSAKIINSLICVNVSLLIAQVHINDQAGPFGITGRNVFGGLTSKQLILETTGSGAAVADFDGDGQNEVLLLNGTTWNTNSPAADPAGPRRSFLYVRDAQAKGKVPRFLEKVGFGLPDDQWYQGLCAGDVDNDGLLDLAVTSFGPVRLLRNQGGLQFADESARRKLPAGVADGVPHFHSGCTFLDFDLDGRLDLFVARYVHLDPAKTPKPGQGEFCVWKEIPVMCGPRGLPLSTNLLLHQQPDGSFQDVSQASGILAPGGRYALQAVSADFNNDGWPDIYVACDMTPSLLYVNQGNGTFVEKGVEMGVAYNNDGRLQAGMGVAVGDFDNDGFLDVAKTNFSGDLTSLYWNEGGTSFTDISGPARLGVRQLLGWGIAFLDWDDDGWKDLLLVNGHVYPEVERAQVGDRYLQETVLFRNLGRQRFADVTREGGPGLAVPRASRALAVGDLDGDGRPEAVINNMNALPAVLQNTAARKGNFVNLTLRGGPGTNRAAIGARVVVRAGGRTFTEEVVSGSSFYSQHALTLHVGIGAATAVEEVEVHWPARQPVAVSRATASKSLAGRAGSSMPAAGRPVQRFRGLPINANCTLQQGATAPACVAY